MRQIFVACFFLGLLAACGENVKPPQLKVQVEAKKELLFKHLFAQESGVSFVNKLNETPEHNVFTYEYFYNGRGFGVGYFYNDGLPDIYFGANQSGDAFYINKGELQFEDQTEKSGISKNQGWTNGVSVVDINADGWLDVYVCRSGPEFGDNGNNSTATKTNTNRLFVNQQDGTFEEQSANFGLDYTGHSTHALFLDFDQDNDLDLYLLTHPTLTGSVNFQQLLEMRKSGKMETDRFFVNQGGKYVDRTQQMGIDGFGFGLGVSAADLNGDGWTDIYVANDYDEPDFIWVNQQGKGFANEANTMLGHTSNYSMGCDIGDINSDGLSDVFVADMAFESHFRSKTNMPSMRPELFNQRVAIGYHYQYMHNTLQLNRGDGKFSEIAHLSGVAKTDWSWAPLIEDVNQDGKQDVFITNGFRRDVRENDLRKRILEERQKNQSEGFVLEDVLALINSEKIPNRLFLQGEDLQFEKATELGLDQPTWSNGAIFSDLDNDGDLDLVVNNLDMKSAIYENTVNGEAQYIRLVGEGNNLQALGAEVVFSSDNGEERKVAQSCRGYQSSIEPLIAVPCGWDGNTIRVYWPNGQKTQHTIDGNTITLSANDGEPWVKEEFEPLFVAKKVSGIPAQKVNQFNDFAREILLPHKYSTDGPALVKGDVNSDGASELFLGGAYREPSFTLKRSGKNWESTKLPNSERYSDVDGVFFDVENDGDLDLYVVSGGAHQPYGSPLLRDRIYVNDGAGNYSLSNWKDAPATNGGGVIAGDTDGDSDTDLFSWSTYRPGKYGQASSWEFWRNDGGRLINDQTKINATFEGMITDALFWDYDLDGDKDLVVCGEWMGIVFLKNEGGIFEEDELFEEFKEMNGWWQSLALFYPEGRKHPQLVVGNFGANNKFHPTKEKPLKLFAGDFDKNGTHDIVLGKYEKDKLFPVRGRECSSEQMPFVAEKFPTFEEFAEAELDEIIPAHDPALLEIERSVVEMQHISIYQGTENWHWQHLPVEAQFSPILSMTQLGDKLIAVGNHFGTEVETTRYDAGFGTVLQYIGETEKHWTCLSPSESGFAPKGDLREALIVDGQIVVGSHGFGVSFWE